MPSMAILRYLAVPLRTAPLLLIATFSLLLMLAGKAGLIGLPLAFILLSWFFKYAFVVLDNVVEGVTDLPALSTEMVNPVDDHRSLLLLALAVGIYFLAEAVSGRWGPEFGTAVLVAGAVIVPAMIAVQGATGSIVDSFNPVAVFRLIAQLRGDYALVLGCGVLLALLGQALVSSQIGNALPSIVRVALLMYAWLALFSLIGGALFERRLDIGLDASHAPERIEAKHDAEIERIRDRQMDGIYAEWRGGAHANAWKTVIAHLGASVDRLAELRWMYQRAAHWPDARLAGRLAQEMLPGLLAGHETGKALDLVRERLAADPSFRPLSSADLLTLVRLAREAGDRPTARALLNDFARFYPNDPARLMAETISQQLAR